MNPVTLAVSTPTLPTGFVNSGYNGTGYLFTSTGGTGTITWTMSPANVVNLALSSSGLLSDTPNATYSSTISVTATDSATNQTQTKTITPSLTVSNALTITTGTGSLPYAYTGQIYTTTTLAASGGSGSGYTWTVTAGQSSLTALNLAVSASGAITGTPSATGTANFTVQVADNASHTATATFSITAYAPLALPAGPTPSTLPAGTTTASYTGSITVTGGVSPYGSWLFTGLSDGLTGTVTGGGTTLSITGSPTTTGTVTFQVSVTDSAGTTVSPITYTIAVSTTYNVGGNISLTNSCGGGSSVPTISLTLTQGTNRIQTVATDSNGNYTFMGIANGAYTITPSISGPTSVFYPATSTVTVSNANFSTANFSVALGYTVSGTASYTGTVSQAKPIYLTLSSSSNCGSSSNNPGTSVYAAGGSFTINGVPPGTYTLSAYQDNLGYGSQNTSNPSGTAAGVTVAAANLTGANVTLTDPGTTTLPSAPTLQGVAGFNNGALVQYKAITNSNGEEMATSYTLQWSTASTFTSIAGFKTFPATGAGGANLWFVNKDMTTANGCTNCSTLTNGSTYYFRVYGTSAGTATSAYGVFPVSGSPYLVTIGAPAPTGGVAVSGAVTYPGTAAGPMYVGFFNYSAGNFYGQYIASLASAQAYTIQVPIASTYYFISIVDNNNNGVIDAGDLSDVNNTGNPPTANITGATTGENLTLAGGNSLLSTYTGHIIQTGQSDSYQVNANVRSSLKLPAAVELISAGNPDVIVPQDIAVCTSCGNHQFQWQASTQSTVPAVGDTYGLKVTYSDGTSDVSLPATVTAVLPSSAAATALSNGGSTRTQSSFSWTYPTAPPTNATYQFWICCSNNSYIWQIPGSNSKSSSNFTSSQITPPLVWGTDPTDNTNTPTGPLSTGTSYTWTIETLDINNNYLQTTVNYTP